MLGLFLSSFYDENVFYFFLKTVLCQFIIQTDLAELHHVSVNNHSSAPFSESRKGEMKPRRRKGNLGKSRKLGKFPTLVGSETAKLYLSSGSKQEMEQTVLKRKDGAFVTWVGCFCRIRNKSSRVSQIFRSFFHLENELKPPCPYHHWKEH